MAIFNVIVHKNKIRLSLKMRSVCAGDTGSMINLQHTFVSALNGYRNQPRIKNGYE
jgi:hypothetical protein